jgi:predicted O-methyltransferase YrrM
LKIIHPRLRPGAIVFADNVEAMKPRYKDFLEYIENPANGFKSTIVPFSGGLLMAVRIGAIEV